MAEDQALRPIAESVDGLIIDEAFYKEQFEDIPGISRTNNLEEGFGQDDGQFENVGIGEITAKSKDTEGADMEELSPGESEEAIPAQNLKEDTAMQDEEEGSTTGRQNSLDNDEEVVNSHDKSAVAKEIKDQEENLKDMDTQLEEPSENQGKPLIGNSIGDHIAKKIEEELSPEQHLEEIKEASNTSTATAPITMLTGVSTAVISTSGRTTTSVTTITFEPAYTKIKRCIYGCRVLSVETAAAKIAIVTALPVTVPCSLVICPPCGCTTKIVSVQGCPVITTVTPPDSFVIITNDTTITFFTVTTTVTSCTATTTLPPSTVTITQTTESPSLTTVTQFSTLSLTTITQFSTQKLVCTPTPIVPDGCCPADHNWDGKPIDQGLVCRCGKLEAPDCPCQSKPKPACRCGRKGRGGCSSCRKQPVPQGCEGGECPFFNFKAQVGETKDDQHEISDANDSQHEINDVNDDQHEINDVNADQDCMPCKHKVPSGVTSTITGSVCTTFVVCNPVQFSCPAQVTGAAQLSKFMDTWGLGPNVIPGGFPYAYLAGGIPRPGMEYLGYDGKMYGVGGGNSAGFIASSPANLTDPSSNPINTRDSLTTTCTSAASTSHAMTKEPRVKAAAKKNQADSQVKSSLLMILGIASAFYGFIA